MVEIAERQHGVIAFRQLIAIGFGRGAIQHRVALGRLHRLHVGVFAVGRRRVGLHGRWMAGVLAHGPDTKRELEAGFFDFCREFGLPLPVTNVLVEGFLVDATSPGSKLIVELDSYAFHGHRKAFEVDRRRDAVLLLADYRVLRVTWRRLNEEPQMLASAIRARI